MSKFKDDFRASFLRSRNMVWRKGIGGTKFWLNVLMLIFLAVVLIGARKNIVRAWHLLEDANIWLILLLVPLQFASYYANTEIFFSYLRARGQLRQMKSIHAMSMALEFTFVDHVFPAAGVAGASYMVWRLKHYGVPTGQATMTQVMRFVVEFGTFMVLMVAALVWATMQDLTADWVVVGSTIAVMSLIFVLLFGNYVFGSKDRIISFSHWLSHLCSAVVRVITFGRKHSLAKASSLDAFFLDFNNDIQALKQDRRLLRTPIAWSFLFNILDISLFYVTFLSLGQMVNPAVLVIAYGAGNLCGNFMITPGGIGAYEAVMVTILSTGGVDPAAALAGVILARMLLLIGTLSTGFVAYQRALNKYGKPMYYKSNPDEAKRG